MPRGKISHLSRSKLIKKVKKIKHQLETIFGEENSNKEQHCHEKIIINNHTVPFYNVLSRIILSQTHGKNRFVVTEKCGFWDRNVLGKTWESVKKRVDSSSTGPCTLHHVTPNNLCLLFYLTYVYVGGIVPGIW